MLQRGVNQLLAVRRIHLERPGHGAKLQKRPTRPKVRIRVAKRRTVLPEVAVQRAREALERHAKVLVQTLEDDGRQRRLRQLRFLLVGAGRAVQEARVALQHAVHAPDEKVKLFVVEAVVAVQLFLGGWNETWIRNAGSIRGQRLV